MDFLKLLERYFGVDRGRIELLVTEQLLDEANVSPIVQHVRGATVTKNMTPALVFQPG